VYHFLLLLQITVNIIFLFSFFLGGRKPFPTSIGRSHVSESVFFVFERGSVPAVD
jgi:hypothetical protein